MLKTQMTPVIAYRAANCYVEFPLSTASYLNRVRRIVHAAKRGRGIVLVPCKLICQRHQPIAGYSAIQSIVSDDSIFSIIHSNVYLFFNQIL